MAKKNYFFSLELVPTQTNTQAKGSEGERDMSLIVLSVLRAQLLSVKYWISYKNAA